MSIAFSSLYLYFLHFFNTIFSYESGTSPDPTTPFSSILRLLRRVPSLVLGTGLAMTGEPFVGCHESGGDEPLPYGDAF